MNDEINLPENEMISAQTMKYLLDRESARHERTVKRLIFSYTIWANFPVMNARRWQTGFMRLWTAHLTTIRVRLSEMWLRGWTGSKAYYFSLIFRV